MKATRLDVSFERRKAQFLEKENNTSNMLQRSIRKSPTKKSLERIDENRYQRGQQTMIKLATYQSKYEKLEQNFKKFSHNIKSANQTDEMIYSLKLKAGLQILEKIGQKEDLRNVRASYQIWKLNSGVALK